MTVELLLMENTVDIHIFQRFLMRDERNNFILEAKFFHPCTLGWDDKTDFAPSINLIDDGIFDLDSEVKLRSVYFTR